MDDRIESRRMEAKIQKQCEKTLVQMNKEEEIGSVVKLQKINLVPETIRSNLNDPNITEQDDDRGGSPSLRGKMKAMNQVIKEEKELGMSSQGGVGLVPEPERIKLEIDDPKVVKVMDGSKNPSFAGLNDDDDDDGSKSQFLREYLERNLPKSAPWTREEEYEHGMLKVFDKKLAESGVDIKAMRERWKTCNERCQKCGDIDYHPEAECPYLRFIYI